MDFLVCMQRFRFWNQILLNLGFVFRIQTQDHKILVKFWFICISKLNNFCFRLELVVINCFTQARKNNSTKFEFGFLQYNLIIKLKAQTHPKRKKIVSNQQSQLFLIIKTDCEISSFFHLINFNEFQWHCDEIKRIN